MKELYDSDPTKMTNRQLYESAMERAGKMGACVAMDAVILLEDECRRYREKITELQKELTHETGKGQSCVHMTDTVITIHSDRKMSSVDIYFQEDEG